MVVCIWAVIGEIQFCSVGPKVRVSSIFSVLWSPFFSSFLPLLFFTSLKDNMAPRDRRRETPRRARLYLDRMRRWQSRPLSSAGGPVIQRINWTSAHLYIGHMCAAMVVSVNTFTYSTTNYAFFSMFIFGRRDIHRQVTWSRTVLFLLRWRFIHVLAWPIIGRRRRKRRYHVLAFLRGSSRWKTSSIMTSCTMRRWDVVILVTLFFWSFQKKNSFETIMQLHPWM